MDCTWRSPADFVPDGITHQRLKRENTHWCRTARMWCRTARATRLRDYFPYLMFYLFLRLYYFFLDRFLPFPIYRTLGHWKLVSGLCALLESRFSLGITLRIGRIGVCLFYSFASIQDYGILLLFYVFYHDEV